MPEAERGLSSKSFIKQSASLYGGGGRELFGEERFFAWAAQRLHTRDKERCQKVGSRNECAA